MSLKLIIIGGSTLAKLVPRSPTVLDTTEDLMAALLVGGVSTSLEVDRRGKRVGILYKEKVTPTADVLGSWRKRLGGIKMKAS